MNIKIYNKMKMINNNKNYLMMKKKKLKKKQKSHYFGKILKRLQQISTYLKIIRPYIKEIEIE